MSKYEQYKELSNDVEAAKTFLVSLQSAAQEDINLDFSDFKVVLHPTFETLLDESDKQVTAPPLLVAMLNAMIKEHCTQLSEVAVKNMEQELLELGAEAKIEAEAIINEIATQMPTIQPKAKTETKPATTPTPEKAPPKAAAKPTTKNAEPKPKHKNLIPIGTKFNHFTIVRFAPEKTTNKQVYLCRCICGNEKFIDKYSLPSRFSCGCITKNQAAKQQTSYEAEAAAILPPSSNKKTASQKLEERREQRELAAALGDGYE